MHWADAVSRSARRFGCAHQICGKAASKLLNRAQAASTSPNTTGGPTQRRSAMNIVLVNPPHTAIGSRVPDDHLPPLG
ncbi:MAG: hypothetical protein E5X90_16690, partial [Mesorhizobium sp.]